jgi:PAS domain S-box-containing protein
MQAAEVLPFEQKAVSNFGPRGVLIREETQPSLFEQIINKAPDLIFITDLRGRFSFVNDYSVELTGYTRDELLGMSFSTLVVPSHRGRVFRFYSRQYLTGKKESYLEFPILTKGRKEIWVGQKVLVEMIYRMPAFICIARDISEKKQAEELLRASEKKYHELFEHAVQPMFQTTPEGRLVAANPALLKLLGYSSVEELSTIDLIDLYVNPDDRRQLGAMLQLRGYLKNVELRLKRKDGKIITVLEHSRAIRDQEGRIVMYEGILEDITLRKAQEEMLQEYVKALSVSEKQLRELNEQKNKLFSILSHDLRSPFASILGLCDVLLEEESTIRPEERKEFLTYIKEAAQSQLRLVNRLLEWSRVESGRINVNTRELDLGERVASSIVNHLGIARQKNIVIRSTLPPGTMVMGDEELVLQVFNNLISNALKFTPEGGVVTIGLEQEKDDRVIVSVRDNGVGIPAEDIPKLFRIGEKYTRRGLGGEIGTGLGLPVIAEVMEKIGGSVWCESEEGNGACFYLAFPKISRGSG